MKEELKIIYDKGIKRIFGMLTSPFVIASSWAAHKKNNDNNNGSPVDDYPFVRAICGTLVGVMGGTVALGESLKNFSQGDIKMGLIMSTPLITNTISGLYELYRWAHSEAKEEEGKEGNLEKELAPSRAKGIEKAVQYLSFESNGSLHTNGNYDADKKRIQYQEIIKKIPKKSIANIREKLDENLSALRTSEQVNPEAIRRYFKEKFGVPIDNYSDLDLFYRTLLEQETGKNI